MVKDTSVLISWWPLDSSNSWSLILKSSKQDQSHTWITTSAAKSHFLSTSFDAQQGQNKWTQRQHRRHLHNRLGLICCFRRSMEPRLTTRRLPNQKETSGPYFSWRFTRNSCKLLLTTISGRLPSLRNTEEIWSWTASSANAALDQCGDRNHLLFISWSQPRDTWCLPRCLE